MGIERSAGISTSVLLIGRAILFGTTAGTDVTEQLVRDYEVSRQRFDEMVELLCGNYVLMAAHGRDLTVQGDAAGLRSIFYSAEGKVVGSHAGLVASQIPTSRLTEFHDPVWETGNSVSYLPGVRTIYEGVLQLTPNTELQLDSMTPRRVFPRRPPLSLEVPEIIERLNPLLAEQLDFLVGTGKELMLSLTGGIDSRTSLAILRPIVERLTAFTYVLDFGRFSALPIMGIDAALAGEIASTLSIAHRIARIEEPDIRSSLKEILEANNYHEHIWPLAQWYLDNISPNTLHVRSNLFEIGRAFYRKGRPRVFPLTPELMAETHRKSYSERPAAVEAFREFVRLTDFHSLNGHDPYDFFYWEHRVGRWHGNVVAESDISHETWVLINSRSVLELLLAASLPKRIEAEVYHRLIASQWPALTGWPWNALPDRPSASLRLPSMDHSGIHDP